MATDSSSVHIPVPSVHVILNPNSGPVPADRTQEILESFSRYPGVRCEIHKLRSGQDLAHILKTVFESGANVVAAGGGDGTVSSVAHFLVGRETALGVLPLGTMNHLARDLCIPPDLDAAVDVICSGATIAIDVGEVNGRYFVNNASVGVYPKVVHLRDRWRPIVGKWLGMGLAIIAVLVRMPWLRLQLEWDDHLIRRVVPLLFVGNNPYETRFADLGKRLVLTKGVLWLMTPKEVGAWGLMRALAYGLAGRMWDADEVDVAEVKKLVVRSWRRSITIGMDGEVIKQKTPLVFRSHPAALSVKAPFDTRS